MSECDYLIFETDASCPLLYSTCPCRSFTPFLFLVTGLRQLEITSLKDDYSSRLVQNVRVAGPAPAETV